MRECLLSWLPTQAFLGELVFRPLWGRDEIRAPLKTPACEANAFLESPVLLHLPVTHLTTMVYPFNSSFSMKKESFLHLLTCV